MTSCNHCTTNLLSTDVLHVTPVSNTSLCQTSQSQTLKETVPWSFTWSPLINPLQTRVGAAYENKIRPIFGLSWCTVRNVEISRWGWKNLSFWDDNNHLTASKTVHWTWAPKKWSQAQLAQSELWGDCAKDTMLKLASQLEVKGKFKGK